MKIHEYNEMMAYLLRPEPRQNFDNGGLADTSPVYNEKTGHIYKKGNRFGTFFSKTPPKNQFTAIRPLRSLEELQKVINEAPLIEINGKFFEQNPEDLMGDSEYNTRELISRKELDQKGPDGVRYRDKLKFKSKGKKRIEEVNQGNINRREKIKAAQGSEISIIGGKKINRAFSHVYPIIESAKPGTKTTTVIDADMNNKLIGYNIIGQKIAEDQEYLLKVKPEGYKKEILINNAKAKKNVMNAIQDLGKKYKGQIGYFQVDPETGVFKPKAGNYKMSFAGLEGENKIYKDMTFKERKVFGKKISDIEKLKIIPGITTADKIPVPEKTKAGSPDDLMARANVRKQLSANPFFDPKNILTGLGDVARVLSTPTVAATFAGTKIKENLEKGESLLEAFADVEVGTNLLYPELAKRTVGQIAPRGTGILSTIGRVAANPFFRAARAFTPVGAGLTAIGLGKDAYERYQELEAMSPAEREELAKERDEFSFGEFSGA
jgi:hypothetical protein